MHNISVELGFKAKLNGDSPETEQVKEGIEKLKERDMCKGKQGVKRQRKRTEACYILHTLASENSREKEKAML